MNDSFSEIELRKLDLNLLLVFAAVMRERTVSRAATRLYLGASAVSMALNRLRDALADPLFVRAGSVMEPTPRAVALWADIQPALSAIEGAVRGVRSFDPATTDLVIRFAAPDDLEFVLVPRLIARLSVVAPGMRLAVRPSDFRTLLGRLDAGDADLALSATPTSGLERRHHVQTLYRESFATLFDRRHVKAGGKMDIETFTSLPHVLLSIAGDLHGPIDDLLARHGRSRRAMAAVAHFPIIPFILRQMPCLANVPVTAARHFAHAYDLGLSALPFSSPEFDVALIWHARTASDSAHIWFRGLVAEMVMSLWRQGGTLTKDC
jgi:LysR family transcriptional activator of mexEF-oprN operon